MVDKFAATFAAVLRQSLAQPPAQPGLATPISSASSPWFRPAPTPAVSTAMTASQRQPAQALPQGMLNFCKSMVGRYLEQVSEADMHACLQTAISEVRLKRNSKLGLTKDPSHQASSTPKPNTGQTTTIPSRKPPKKKLDNADVAIEHHAPGDQDMEAGSSEMTPSATTAAQNPSSSGLSSCSDGAAAASTSLFTFTANKEENSDNDHNSPHPWVTKLSKKAAKRARLSAKSNTRTVDSPPKPKTQECHIITLRPKTKTDVTTLPKKGLMEAITASVQLAPGAVSIKTTKETNTITVMVNSEATAQTLLAITEIHIAGKPPLPIQAYKPVGDNQIRSVIYGIDQGEDNVSLMAGLETEGSVIVAARPMSRGGNTALITFQGTHLPRHVWYRRSVLQVHPYRARAVTCSNCHKIGHKPDICPEPQVCSTCGKPHEETMDDQGNATCPSPIPFCQMCRKNGHLATDKYCPRRLDIVRKIREAARRRTTPPGSQDNSKRIRQDYHKKRGKGQQPAPQLTAPTTITIDPAMLLQLFTAIAAQTGTAVQSNPNPPTWQ
ncbi:hypothetical protein ISCGN_005548 [Ixodes scapularis]